MNVSFIIATCGDERWKRLAMDRAVPSALLLDGDCTILTGHSPDLTVQGARNELARLARSDWLCFLDADDELDRGYLRAMADAFMRGAITTDWSPLLVPAVRYVTAGVPMPRHQGQATIPNRGRWPSVNECVIGTLVRRERFEQVGGFREVTDDGCPITLYEDWDLWLRCHDAGAQLVYVEDAVYRAHVNPQGRNGGGDSQVVYAAIWSDHLARVDRKEGAGP